MSITVYDLRPQTEPLMANGFGRQQPAHYDFRTGISLPDAGRDPAVIFSVACIPVALRVRYRESFACVGLTTATRGGSMALQAPR
jgi:hypothetical protein